MLDEVELKRLYLLWRVGVMLQRKHPNSSIWHDLREAYAFDTYDHFKNALVGPKWGYNIRIKPSDQS